MKKVWIDRTVEGVVGHYRNLAQMLGLQEVESAEEADIVLCFGIDEFGTYVASGKSVLMLSTISSAPMGGSPSLNMIYVISGQIAGKVDSQPDA